MAVQSPRKRASPSKRSKPQASETGAVDQLPPSDVVDMRELTKDVSAYHPHTPLRSYVSRTPAGGSLAGGADPTLSRRAAVGSAASHALHVDPATQVDWIAHLQSFTPERLKQLSRDEAVALLTRIHAYTKTSCVMDVTQLPVELFFEVFGWLELGNLCALRETCKSIHNYVKAYLSTFGNVIRAGVLDGWNVMPTRDCALITPWSDMIPICGLTWTIRFLKSGYRARITKLDFGTVRYDNLIMTLTVNAVRYPILHANSKDKRWNDVALPYSDYHRFGHYAAPVDATSRRIRRGQMHSAALVRYYATAVDEKGTPYKPRDFPAVAPPTVVSFVTTRCWELIGYKTL